MARYRSFLLAVSSCLLLEACPGTIDDPGAFVPCTAETVPTVVFAKKCSNNICHGAGDEPAGELDLESPNVAERLIGKQSRFHELGDAGIGPDGGYLYTCTQRVLIDPADPTKSFLIDKVSESSPECGDPMPATGSLSDKEIQCIKDWVVLVAGDSGTGSGGSGGSAGSGTPDASVAGSTAAGAGGL